ncbi:MAG: hypothetical protein WBP59_01410, partial [Ilumatobacteraceae bacterium]
GELGVARSCTFAEVIEAAASNGVLAVGWSLQGHTGIEVLMNPCAGESRNLLPDDQIVVVG